MKMHHVLVLLISVVVEQSMGFCPLTGMNSISNRGFNSFSCSIRKCDTFCHSMFRTAFLGHVNSNQHTRSTSLARFIGTRNINEDEYFQDDADFVDPAGVVGGGALRGEQDFYSMRDLQKMRVTRLKSMCEARYCILLKMSKTLHQI